MFSQHTIRHLYQPYFASPYNTIMDPNPYPYRDSSPSDHSRDQTRRSLSSTTDVSQHYPTGQSGLYSPSPQYYPSQHAMMHPPPSAHSYYAQSTHSQAQTYGVPPPVPTLRDLPFSNSHPVANSGGHAPSMYSSGHPSPRSAYGAQGRQSLTPPAQYGASAAPASPRGTSYIPTPAQTMTMQNYRGAPSSASSSRAHGTIVVPPAAASSASAERYPCDKCDRTFSRPHDRKRHNESQHQQIAHICQHCDKDFSRSDSLKRHIDNGCDRAPPL